MNFQELLAAWVSHVTTPSITSTFLGFYMLPTYSVVQWVSSSCFHPWSDPMFQRKSKIKDPCFDFSIYIFEHYDSDSMSQPRWEGGNHYVHKPLTSSNSACLFQSLCACATLWIVARQALQFMGFSRQEYWSGLPCHSPGDLPNPGTEPMSLSSVLQADSLPTEPSGKPLANPYCTQIKEAGFPPPFSLYIHYKYFTSFSLRWQVVLSFLQRT